MYHLLHPLYNTAEVKNSSEDRRTVGRYAYSCEPNAERLRGLPGVLPEG